MANKASGAGGLDSPMTPYNPKEVGPNPSEGNFYGPNMSGHVAQHQPTPGECIPTKVQFYPLGSAPGPLDTPFNTAIPTEGSMRGTGGPAGVGEGRGNGGLDTPMTTQPKGNGRY